jgi:hypothetical protein
MCSCFALPHNHQLRLSIPEKSSSTNRNKASESMKKNVQAKIAPEYNLARLSNSTSPQSAMQLIQARYSAS